MQWKKEKKNTWDTGSQVTETDKVLRVEPFWNFSLNMQAVLPLTWFIILPAQRSRCGRSWWTKAIYFNQRNNSTGRADFSLSSSFVTRNLFWWKHNQWYKIESASLLLSYFCSIFVQFWCGNFLSHLHPMAKCGASSTQGHCLIYTKDRNKPHGVISFTVQNCLPSQTVG